MPAHATSDLNKRNRESRIGFRKDGGEPTPHASVEHGSKTDPVIITAACSAWFRSYVFINAHIGIITTSLLGLSAGRDVE